MANPILLDFPESFETERLLIRAPQAGDGAELNEAIRESRSELLPYMPFAKNLPTVEESEIFSREGRISYLKRSSLYLRIFDKHTGAFIGCSGLHGIDWEAGKFEIGYWVRTSCSGKGYITEAVNGIVDFAIRELAANRLEIRCNAANVRSAAVAERTGFKLDGILRKERLENDGQLHDMKIYAKVRGDEF